MADITGTSGDDLLFQNANEDDRIDGLGGIDTLDLSGMGEAARLFLALSAPQVIGASQGTDTVLNIENVIGTAFNDLIVGVNGGSHLSGGAGDDQLQGRGGADVLDGGVGDDLLIGNGGDDVLLGSSGKDVLRPGEGADIVDGSSGTDRVDFSNVSRGVSVDLSAGRAIDLDGSGAVNTGLTSIEDVTGSAHDDVLSGDAGPNRLYGRAGNDALAGGDGNDTLAGGAGDDVIATGGGRDYVVAGTGDDVITTGLGRATVVGEEGSDTIDYSAETRDMFINLTSRRGFVQDGSLDVNDRLYELENVEAGSGNDTVVGTDGDVNRINLGDGDDYADGKSGDDIISGGAGNDTLIGRTGNDDLQGGAGDDYLRGDEGDDVLTAGDGSDTLLGGDGADRLIANGTAGGTTTLTGGNDGDVFEVHEGLQTVHITDFASGTDLVALQVSSVNLVSFADLLALRSAPDTVQIGDLTLVFDGLDIEADLTGADFGLDSAPVTTPLNDTTHEDVNLYSLDLLTSQTDPEGDALGVANLTQVGGPEANYRLNGSTLEFFPGRYGNLEAGQQVELVFQYDVTDGANVSTNTATVIVEGRNELLPTLILPTARDDAASLDEDGATTVNVVANDAANTILLANNKQVISFDASGFDGAITLQSNKKIFEIDANGAFEYLGEGETVTQSIHYTMQNAVGGRDNAFLDITVTGSNDGIMGFTIAPSGALKELAETDNGASVDILAATGAISFSDADLSDQHSFAITPQGSDYRGGLSASVVSSGADGARQGQWLFEVSDGDLDDLSEGQTLTQVYDIVVDDGHGSTATGTVTLSLTGTNDSVALISIDNATGDLVEEIDLSATENVVTHSAGGTLLFDDVDINDTHFVSVVPSAVGYRGAVTTVLTDSTGTGQGGVAWQFDVADADLDDLAAGQTLTQSYDLIVSDGLAQITETLTITLTGTNDGASISGDNAGAVAEDGTLADSGALTVSDVDNGEAKFVVPADLSGSYGSFTFDETGNWAYSLNNAHGDVQALAAGQTLTDTLTVASFDGTASETITVTITGSNDAPVVQAVRGGTNEDGPAITLSADFTDTDASDTHAFTTDTTGTLGAVANNGDGTFGYDPNGQFEHLAAGETATDSFTYIVDDGNGGIVSNTMTVSITGANDAPVAEDVAITRNEKSSGAIFDLDFADVDNGAMLSFAFDTSATTGFVTNYNDGRFGWGAFGSFDSLAVGETGTDSFTYTVTDEHGASDTATVTITVLGFNDAPVVQAVTGGANEGGPAITLAADFTDADASDTHTFTTDTTGTLGGVTNNGDGTFGYDPNGQFEYLTVGETATDSFAYIVDDGNGGVVSSTMTVTITGTNDAPVVQAVTGGANEDGPAITLAADFTDSDASDSHVFTVDTSGTRGAVTNNNDGTFGYDPDGQFEHLAAGETATDSFTYIVDDGNGGVTSNTMTVTITGANDAPSTAAVNLTVSEDDGIVTQPVVINDVDTNDQHSVTVVGANSGSLRSDGGSNLVFNTAIFDSLGAGRVVTEVYTFIVEDSHGATDTATATITVNGQNDIVQVTGGIFAGTVTESPGNFGVPFLEESFSIFFDDVDVADFHSGEVKSVSSTSPFGAPTLGNLTFDIENNPNQNFGAVNWTYRVANSSLDYLAAGQTEVETFDVVLTDFSLAAPTERGESALQTIQITLTGTNDPVEYIDVAQTDSIAERVDGAADENNVTHSLSRGMSFTDLDLADTHSVSVTPAASGYRGSFHASVVETPPSDFGSVIWSFDVADADIDDLAAGQTLTQTYNLQVADASTSDTQTVTITITGANDAPVAEDVAITRNEKSSGAIFDLDFADVDNGAMLSFAFDTSATTGFVTNYNDGRFGWGAFGSFDSLAVGETGTDSFTYTVTDEHGASDTATVTITVLGFNDAPVVQAVTGGANEGGPAITLTADFTDVDASDTHTFSTDTTGTLGAVTDNGDGTFGYDPNGQFETLAAGETATDSFTYIVDDGNGGVVSNTMTVTITGANDGASISGDNAGAVAEDGTLADSGTLTVSDVDNGEAKFVVPADLSGSYGSFTFDETGNWAYSLNNAHGDVQALSAGQTLTDTLTVESFDGTASETISVTITGSNDAPVVQAVRGGTNEDGPAITLSADFTDTDATDTHAFRLNATSSIGSVSNNADGTFGYDPNGQFEHLAAGETATDSFTYIVDDGNGGVVSNTMTVSITGQNDDPVAVDDDYTHPDLGSESDTTQFRDASYLDQGEGHAAARSFVAQTFTAGAGSLEAVSLITNHQDGPDAMEFRVLVTEFTGSGASFQPTDILFDSGKIIGSGPAQGQIFSRIDTGNLGLIEGDDYAIVIDFVTDRDGDTGYGRLSVTAAQDRMPGHDMYLSTSNTGDPVADFAGGFIKYLSGGNPNYDLALTFEYGPPALTDEESAHIFAAADLLDNDSDVDASDTLTIAAVDDTASTGSVVLNGDGTVSYNPNGQFETLAVGEMATDSFTYTIDDGNGGTDSATVTLAIEGVNDAPVAVNITGAINEDDVSIALSPSFTDIDASDTHAISIDDSGTVGVVSPDGAGGFIYGPNGQFEHLAAGETTTDSFTYIVDDGNGGTDTATATITITGQNDAPTMTADAAVTINENSALVPVNAVAADVDTGDTTIFEIAGGDDAALFSIDANSGDLSFLNGPDYENPQDVGADNVYNVAIAARDAAGAVSASHAVAITVADVADNAPYTPHLFDYNSNLVVGFSDSDGDDLVDRFDASTGLPNGSSYGLASADFNNDGLIDLAKSDFSSNGAVVHINQGDSNNDGVPEFVSTFENDIPRARSLEAEDINGDNLPDLLIAGNASNADGIMVNQGDPDGDGDIDFAPVILAGASAAGNGSSYGIGSGDFNNDGYRDVVVPQWSTGPTQIFYGEGDPDGDGLPNFSAGSDLPEPVGNIYDITVDIGDIDNDGDDDIIVGNWSGVDPNLIYLNQGDTSGDGLPDFTAHAIPNTATFSYAIKLADFDADGLLDIVYSDHSGSASSVLMNQGDTDGDDVPDFAKIDLGVRSQFLDVGDVDGDGDWDIALGLNNTVTFAHNMGDTDGDGLVNFALSPTIIIGHGFRIELVEDSIGI